MNKIDTPIVLHKGIYKKSATVGEAVFMITGMTIGAGILGLPYVVAKVGLIMGLVLIVVWGVVMLLLNLMLGEVAVRTKESFQLPGFAGKYLGKWAKYLLSATIILSGFGVLLAYVIGEGEVLSELFGGQKEWWSVLFWSLGSFFIWQGLQTIKSTERILSFLVIILLGGLSIFLLPKIQTANFLYNNLTDIFLPFGVILFALHATPAIVEAHALMPDSQKRFRKAIIIGTIIPVVLYLLFVSGIVGFFGANVSEIATISLGRYFGPSIAVLANVFAAIAMATCFMGIGLSLKQTLIWDQKLNRYITELVVISVPLVLFLAGLRSFVAVIDVVGGVFIGLEALMIVLICYQARKKGALSASRFGTMNFWLTAIPVVIFFIAAALYSIINIF